MRERVRGFLDWLVPWFDVEAEAQKHAESEAVIRTSRRVSARANRVIASFRRTDETLRR